MIVLELSRPVALDHIGDRRTHHSIIARPAERTALAARFGLADLDDLAAEFDVCQQASGIRVTGRVTGRANQVCVVSGADVPVTVDETVDLLFAKLSAVDAEEIELSAPDLDILPLEGDLIDLGEVAAETFGLVLDPFPRASEQTLAQARSRLASEEDIARLAAGDAADRNPFRVLKGGKDN